MEYFEHFAFQQVFPVWFICHRRVKILYHPIEELKYFIIQDGRKAINKVLKGIQKMTKKDNKLTLQT